MSTKNSIIEKENFKKNKDKNETLEDNKIEVIEEKEEEVSKEKINELFENATENIKDDIKEDTYTIIEEKKKSGILPLFRNLVLAFLTILFILFILFICANIQNDKIYSNIYIQGIDVSGLTKEQAKEKVSNYINNKIPEEIILKHNDYEISISSNEFKINFDIDSAVGWAYNIGRTSNIVSNNLEILKIKMAKEEITPYITLDTEKLKEYLNTITTELPDKVIDSGYYIEDSNLIITKGSEGKAIDVDKTINYIKEQIKQLNLTDRKLELITKTRKPNQINIEDVYSKVYKEPQDAYFTQDPFAIYPSEDGVDFNISIDEAKELLKEDKEEYVIPLKILYPNITTSMIGTEAFPDTLASFSTNYSTKNTNRTTNLILAANKINGTVVMPGDTFSYNTVVGARTIAAGYKEAAIYVNGEVVDGLGGGICQIATTLYNAVVYANLEIVERRNHQFVPSYVGASRDATVVYGATDFQFKNNREYPVKIVCSVSGGVVNFEVRGLKTDNEFEVEISSRVTSRTTNTLNSVAYKILKQNGQVVGSEVLSTDSYKRH